jgi:hypothetical protein
MIGASLFCRCLQDMIDRKKLEIYKIKKNQKLINTHDSYWFLWSFPPSPEAEEEYHTGMMHIRTIVNIYKLEKIKKKNTPDKIILETNINYTHIS